MDAVGESMDWTLDHGFSMCETPWRKSDDGYTYFAEGRHPLYSEDHALTLKMEKCCGL